MFRLDDDLEHFMQFWFAGLTDGLEKLDEPARDTVLRECGKACARSYTAEVFREARRDSGGAGGGLAGFLAALGERFPGSTYELLGAEARGAATIRVRYASCGCDLVETGLVTSPLICDCSTHNLRENFEQGLGAPVSVSLEGSILRGAPACEFLVSLGVEARAEGSE